MLRFPYIFPLNMRLTRGSKSELVEPACIQCPREADLEEIFVAYERIVPGIRPVGIFCWVSKGKGKACDIPIQGRAGGGKTKSIFLSGTSVMRRSGLPGEAPEASIKKIEQYNILGILRSNTTSRQHSKSSLHEEHQISRSKSEACRGKFGDCACLNWHAMCREKHIVQMSARTI